MRYNFSVTSATARSVAWHTAILMSAVLMGRDVHAEVTAVVDNGVLVITSDQEHDVIALSGLLDDDILLAGGVNQSITRADVTTILVHAKNDRVGIANFEFAGDVVLHLGNQGSLTSLQDVTIGRDLTIDSWAAGVTIEFTFVEIGRDLYIETGSQIDVIEAFDVMIGRHLSVNTGSDNDRVQFRFWDVLGDVSIIMGGSNGGGQFGGDQIELLWGYVGSDMFLGTGNGDDQAVIVSAMIAGGLFAHMGPASDRLFLSNVDVPPGATIFLDGGQDNSDELLLFGMTILPEEYIGFETVTIP